MRNGFAKPVRHGRGQVKTLDKFFFFFFFFFFRVYKAPTTHKHHRKWPLFACSYSTSLEDAIIIFFVNDHFFSKVTSSPIGEYEFTVVLLTNCRDDMKIPSSTVSPFLVENELRANHCLFSPKPLSICFIERRWVLAGILCVVEAELVDLQGRNICLLQPLPLLNLSSYTFQSEGPTFFPGRDINL